MLIALVHRKFAGELRQNGCPLQPFFAQRCDGWKPQKKRHAGRARPHGGRPHPLDAEELGNFGAKGSMHFP